MIKSFKCKETEKIFHQSSSRKIPVDIQNRALNKLRMIDLSNDIKDLLVPPSNKLESLTGNRTGQHSIRINQQWRVCFVWNNKNAYNVEIIDYH